MSRYDSTTLRACFFVRGLFFQNFLFRACSIWCLSWSTSSRLERGDVVLAKPSDWQFSDAEKSGFLIIKVRINETLANLIIHPLNEIRSLASDDKPAAPEEIKRRKFAVDLAKIGIAKDDEKGREIDDHTFDYNILYQK